MITAHLTEKEIQLYATEPESISDELTAHIQGCALCQSSTANYLLLFKSIHDTAKPTFDFNLSALVLEQIPAPKRALPWAIILVLLLSITVAAVPALFFWSAIVTVIVGMSGILFTIAGTGTVVIIIFQTIEMLKDHQKRMNILLIQKTLQL